MSTIKDPLQVKYYEKKIGRKLTDAEKYGHCPIIVGKDIIWLELTELSFPYDLMDRTILFQLSKKISSS